MYLIVYGAGRLWIEGLRTDSLCTNGIGGDCAGALRTAQVVSLLLIAGGLIGMFINHRWTLRTAAAAKQLSTEAEPSPTASSPTADLEAQADAPRTDEPLSTVAEPSPTALSPTADPETRADAPRSDEPVGETSG
jgi:hypothetical protein